MHRKRPRQGQFALMNARRERLIAALRRTMIQAAMAGGKSGFAVQMQTDKWEETPLRLTVPRWR